MTVASLKSTMVIDYPSGRKVEVNMHDDGLHADLFSNDGIYGGVVEVSNLACGPAAFGLSFACQLLCPPQALEPGQYSARAVFEGVTASGVRFVRSTEHSFHVVQPYISLTGGNA